MRCIACDECSFKQLIFLSEKVCTKHTNGYQMTTSDRPALVRCTILLSAMTWILPGSVLLIVYSLLMDMNHVLSGKLGSIPLEDVTIQMRISSLQQGHGLSMFAVAFGVFAVFAIGILLASISLWTGKQAMRLGATDLTLLTAVIGSAIYLGGTLMILVGAIIG
ncbi:MAG: hypothetical protein CMJ40_08090 [Phycisphaerae bacterium]|nr:hypothetical protein [Phycisphaerae bacterium]|tara:strand:+ start:2448 stop:2939 length:492 start_codon:yes stop_codon:yes gene_type:complete